MPYKLLERLFLVRLGPFSDAQIPNHQAGSQRGRSTVQQAGKLIDNIAVCFEEKRKAGLVLVDLTALMAAYHIAWHQRLTLELLQVIVDRQMVRFIVNIIANGSLKRKTSDGECSRMRRLRNSLPQGSYRWCLCCLTSISAIFPQPGHTSADMPTTWPYSTPTSLGKSWRKFVHGYMCNRRLPLSMETES